MGISGEKRLYVFVRFYVLLTFSIDDTGCQFSMYCYHDLVVVIFVCFITTFVKTRFVACHNL